VNCQSGDTLTIAEFPFLVNYFSELPTMHPHPYLLQSAQTEGNIPPAMIDNNHYIPVVAEQNGDAAMQQSQSFPDELHSNDVQNVISNFPGTNEFDGDDGGNQCIFFFC
jgi:hypothetical protein